MLVCAGACANTVLIIETKTFVDKLFAALNSGSYRKRKGEADLNGKKDDEGDDDAVDTIGDDEEDEVSLAQCSA